MVKIELRCTVCGTRYFYDLIDILAPRICCGVQLALVTRLDKIDLSAEFVERLGALGEELLRAIVFDSQKVVCSLCKSKVFFFTTMPYGSAYDGIDVCADCVRKHFDPVINALKK